MKMTKKPNPLSTVVELDEHEKQLLWYKLKLEWMDDTMFSAYFELTSRLKDEPGLPALSMAEAVSEAVKHLDPDYWCGDEGKTPLDKRMDEMLQFNLDELQSTHSGDCTAFPASCGKCHAERLLGISTLPKASKGVNHSIYNAFTGFKDGAVIFRSVDEALQILQSADHVYAEAASNILRQHVADLQH